MEMPEETLRERVVALEVRLEHMSEKIDTMSNQVSELHDVLTRAKGAQWMMIVLMTGVGFVAGKIGGIFAALGLVK